MEILLTKAPGGALIPLDDEQAEKIRKFKPGGVIRANIAQARNAAFHRRWFKLVNWAYDIWSETAEMPTHRGQPIQPNFEKFRKDVTILTGYRHMVVGVNLEIRWEADSISFASMDNETFESLYSKTIDVIIGKVLSDPKLTADEVREHIDYLMTFDG
ncbi:DUF1367 family protein [Piscinibacter gummiphilus]|uniref:DUF1367 family protein n=1 Tax=Piscinibacter gummiphilus TaxID=946333 RepID=A0ABZ0CNH6_9BURK|nr:DUF1367 family protein [Piscinibacter gummiphilus]WOB06528.1 DUF1367 family protein [Piscinibacter gummiphilus]